MSIPSAAAIMAQHAGALSPETDIHAAMRHLLKKRLSVAPVVDASGILLGVFSEKDCFRALAAEAFEGIPEGHVAEHMTRDPITVTPEASIFDVANRFLTTPCRYLPVVDSEGRLLGMVSQREALVAIDGMHDNPYLYGSEDHHLSQEESSGVDSAMRRARGS
jgi:CBS domain-containing protein